MNDRNVRSFVPRKRQIWNPLFADQDAVKVFEHWKWVCDHPKARLDKERHDLICEYLQIGYSVEDLQLAIDGNLASSWHRGENPNGVVYDRLSLILNSGDDVDRFMAIGEQAHRMIAAKQQRQAVAEQQKTFTPPTEEEKERVRELLKNCRIRRVA